MNPQDLANISDADARELQWKMDGLKPGEKLRFADFGPLALCDPQYADLYFFKENDRYCMTLRPTVHYPGSYPPMTHLCSQDPVWFREFSMLLHFLRELVCSDPPPSSPQTDTPSNAKASPPKDYEVSRVANLDEVTVPKGKKRSVLDAKTLKKELTKIIMGQEEAVAAISQVVPLHVNKENPKKPLSLFAYGDSGTGKSEMAKALAGVLSTYSPHQYVVSWTDTNTCTEPHSVSRFIGSPPGYVAHESKNAFDLTTETPYVVYIFDEIEKANPELLKLLMAALDEGRVASLKELPNHSWEYDFRRCLFMFTSNLQLGTPDQKRIGFSAPAQVEDIQRTDGAVDIRYGEAATTDPEDEAASLIQKIYKNNEAARKSFIAQGNLTEVASRINYFIGFKPLDDNAKVQILVKQVIESAAEYSLYLEHISSSILQGLVEAAMSEKALIRSFKAVIEGYLAPAFAKAGTKYGGQTVRLMGSIKSPVITPAK